MSELEFTQLWPDLLNKMQYINNINDACNLFSKLEQLKYYIIKHPNDESIKVFISVLVQTYTSLFFTKELVDAFRIPDQFHYYKQLAICANLPYTVHPFYAYFLPKALQTPSELYVDFYGTFFWVLEQYRPDLITDAHLQAVKSFVNQNPNIIRASKDDYSNLDQEIALYHKVMNNSNAKELEGFGLAQQIMDPYEIQRQFINKKVGNIGELYTYRLIQPLYFSCFVARDIKNGFGYDIYYLDQNSIENLVEVKTTMSTNEDDIFSMSENEYQTMINCLGRVNAKYCICRVHLDSKLTPSYLLLTAKDEETLISNDGEIEYKLYQSSNSHKYFQKQPQKKNHMLYYASNPFTN